MKILLALDTSPIAHETTAAVRRTFGSSRASVVVLSVIGPNELETAPTPVLLASVAQNLALLEADQVRTHEQLVARAAQDLRSAGFEASEDVRYGDPRCAIVEAAAYHSADLVVVGCHGRSSTRRRIMGSVAAYVANRAPCNVLVVRHAQGT